MGSTTENASRFAWDSFEIYRKTQNEALRLYLASERAWVMEALPNMPEHEWEMYIAWVKSVGDPLPRKGTWKKLKAP